MLKRIYLQAPIRQHKRSYHRISPILPNDTVHTITAQNVILLGKLLTTGELPRTKVVALAGPAVKESARKYYRVPLGASLEGP